MVKSIITNIQELRKPCELVTKEDNYKEIIQDLKDTLIAHPTGMGLAANQIGICKKICYIRILVGVDPDKKPHYIERVLINPKIIEKDRAIKLVGEGCLSFPGVTVTTKRFVFVTVEYLDEELKPQIGSFQDYESFAIAHEYDHLCGLTIFDKKWKAK